MELNFLRRCQYTKSSCESVSVEVSENSRFFFFVTTQLLINTGGVKKNKEKG